jgi:hypothetical protein
MKRSQGPEQEAMQVAVVAAARRGMSEEGMLEGAWMAAAGGNGT